MKITHREGDSPSSNQGNIDSGVVSITRTDSLDGSERATTGGILAEANTFRTSMLLMSSTLATGTVCSVSLGLYTPSCASCAPLCCMHFRVQRSYNEGRPSSEGFPTKSKVSALVGV